MTRPATFARNLARPQDGANFSPKGEDNIYLISDFSAAVPQEVFLFLISEHSVPINARRLSKNL